MFSVAGCGGSTVAFAAGAQKKNAPPQRGGASYATTVPYGLVAGAGVAGAAGAGAAGAGVAGALCTAGGVAGSAGAMGVGAGLDGSIAVGALPPAAGAGGAVISAGGDVVMDESLVCQLADAAK